MNVQSLLNAVSTMEQVANNFRNMPEQEQEAVYGSLHLRMASLYLLALAKNLQIGLDPYDAYIAVARGDTGIPEERLAVTRKELPPNEEVGCCPCCNSLVRLERINRNMIKDAV